MHKVGKVNESCCKNGMPVSRWVSLVSFSNPIRVVKKSWTGFPSHRFDSIHSILRIWMSKAGNMSIIFLNLSWLMVGSRRKNFGGRESIGMAVGIITWKDVHSLVVVVVVVVG